MRDNSNTRGWMLNGGKRRALDVFYTDYGTKLHVKDGVLIEETVKRPRSDIYDFDDEFPIGFLSSDTPPDSPRMTAEEAADHSQTIKTAEAALKYYNSKHHTNYKLVDPVLSNGSLWSSNLWFHCNFTAKPETSSESSQEDHVHSCTKLFFAEMKLTNTKSGGSKYIVTACRPIDDGKSTTRCEMCSGGIWHPTHGFRQGLYEFKDRELRPRGSGKVLKMQ
ncbi:hypothetical protein RND81_03G169600 [Saponaria officinalis]|uniref:DUF3615 domain-containing protein n=1 Tax=Saponaria officinalis TaxID=3572 RepID=A0AAW1M104_SAPOF